MGRACLGITVAESKLAPARLLLEYREARFAHRLLARPRGGRGPEEVLTAERPTEGSDRTAPR